MDMMTVLAGYSITVHELQLLFTKLKAVDNEWPQCAPKLLKVGSPFYCLHFLWQDHILYTFFLHITHTLLTGSYIIYTSSVKCFIIALPHILLCYIHSSFRILPTILTLLKGYYIIHSFYNTLLYYVFLMSSVR